MVGFPWLSGEHNVSQLQGTQLEPPERKGFTRRLLGYLFIYLFIYVFNNLFQVDKSTKIEYIYRQYSI